MSIRLIPFLLFLAGFLFYVALPIIFLTAFPYYIISEIAMRNYSGEYYLSFYSYLALIYFILFSLGYYLSLKIRITKLKSEIIDHLGWTKIFVPILYSCITLFVVNLSEILSPVGYSDGYDVAHRGQLTTIYLTSIWWFIYFKSGIHSKLMLIIAFIVGLNLLTLGSRLGVTTGLISLLIFYGYFGVTRLHRRDGGRLRYVKWISVLFFAAILMTSIGLLREGSGLTMEGVLSIFAAEPLFIYAGVPAYFSNNITNLIQIPVDLFVGIVGAIPSFLFPLKSDFFALYSAVDSDSVSGFGGMNHLVTLVANFGMIGFPIAAFCEGLWFGMLTRLAYRSAFFRAVALSSVAVIPFILFRDGLQTSVKLLFFNFLIFPYIIIQMLTLIKILVRTATLPSSVVL